MFDNKQFIVQFIWEIIHHEITFTIYLHIENITIMYYFIGTVCVAVYFHLTIYGSHQKCLKKAKKILRLANAQWKWISTFSFDFCLTRFTLVRLHCIEILREIIPVKTTNVKQIKPLWKNKLASDRFQEFVEEFNR